MSDINVVPYIDVMLVLLVIFMVTAASVNPGIVNLPTVGGAKIQTLPPIFLSVDANENITVKREGESSQTLSRLELGAFARTQAENARKQIAIDSLKQLKRGEYLTKDELFTRMKGDKAKTLAIIDLMVQNNEIDEMFKPFPSHIVTRPGRHGSGYMLPKNYKAESDGE
jgi:biopolymer transport protein TolR